MTAPEVRAGCEFRVAGRTLSGVAMRYGEVSPDFRERFVPGAFGEVSTVPVNLQHDRNVILVPDAMLTDTPRELRVRADLPADSAALALVRRGALNGYSIEFHARSERRESGIRVVERAELVGLALVDEGAYPGSRAEVRRRLFSDTQRRQLERDWIAAGRPDDVMGWLHQRVPLESLVQGLGVRMVDEPAGAASIGTGARKTCKCLPAASGCQLVRFQPEAFKRQLSAVDAGEVNVPVHTGSLNPRNMLGDTRTGAVVLDIVPDDAPLRTIAAPGSLVLTFAQGILGTLAGDAVARTIDTSPPIVRPIVDDEQSEYEDVEDEGERVREYADAWITSVLIKAATDGSARGWSTLVLDREGVSGETPYPREVVSPEITSPPLRRFRRWL